MKDEKIIRQVLKWLDNEGERLTPSHTGGMLLEAADIIRELQREVGKHNEKDVFAGFSVIDTKTGKTPDYEKIALTEEWASGLMYSDINGFAVDEDGHLLLTDECGGYSFCPTDRFLLSPPTD